MEWKVIPSSNGKYEASSDGQIRNVATKKIRKPSKNSKGYLQISGVGSSHLVHRLVAEAFIPNPENKPEIDHIDGNPLNCSVDNLRGVTRQENLLNPHRSALISEANRKRVGIKHKPHIHTQDFLDKQQSKLDAYKADWASGIELKDLRKTYGTQYVKDHPLQYTTERGIYRLIRAIC